MRRSSEGAAGVPQHTHTLDVHVEAGPKTEASPRQQQVGEHTAPLPRPPSPAPPSSVCGMHAWYAHTCFGCESAAGIRTRRL